MFFFILQFKHPDTVVPEITKIALGKLMVDICGNEGCKDPTKNEFMRKPIQTMITELENPDHKNKIWKNASINMYDIHQNILHIHSGDKKYRFIVHHHKGEWKAQLTTPT